MLKIGQKLPDTKALVVTENAQNSVRMANYLADKTAAIFAMPGAFTATCSKSHLPNVIAHKTDLEGKGIDEVIILVVNDAFVVREWGRQSGAYDAGITMIADAGSDFTKAIGMNFTATATGFYDRSQRYALLSVNYVVSEFLLEEARSQVLSSGANHLLDRL